MNPILFALRRPYTVLVASLALALTGGVAATRMSADVFPDLNTPVLYVAQPYGGMSPQQMEGFLTNYYEYHFLYINGIEHVESRNIGGVALMKLFFHPGTNMAQAMAETVGYVNRSRALMPPGTVPPFIMRFDAGSVPVGYLVCSSETKTIGQIQDEALFKVRPMFASLPGVSAPPPFGGNQRTVVIRANPTELRSRGMSPDEIVTALSKNNKITPAGNLVVGDKAPFVPVNSLVEDPKELETVPVRVDPAGTVYVRDVATVGIGEDVATGYGLVDGRRAVYILVTKRADASTLDVVNEVKRNLPNMQANISSDIRVSFEFDQSPYVTRAIWGLALEAGLGAVLTGLMVLLFLRDWRSVIVVVVNIPLALLGSLVALWVCGQTINLMTLGGLALAVGVLVDESTVEVENIHAQMVDTPSLSRAVRQGNQQTAVPRLLAMLCVLAVFIPALFMQGAARALFVPLSLSVGFAMVTSYVLSSTLVPVLCVWLLKPLHDPRAAERPSLLTRVQDGYANALAFSLRWRWPLGLAYGVALASAAAWWLLGHPGLGTEIFPAVDAGQFQLRVRAPAGTTLLDSERLAQDVLAEVARQAGGEDKIDVTVTLVGTASYNYPINSIFLWTSGPQESVLRVALKRGGGVRVEPFVARLREALPQLQRERGPAMKDVTLSFEAGDVVSQVMGFGANTPVEVAVHGNSMPDNLAHAQKVRAELQKIPSLRDLAYDQALTYPSLEVVVNRERAGDAGVTPEEVGNAVAPWSLSSRFVAPNFWRDPKNGIGYQVQVELDGSAGVTKEHLEQLPVKRVGDRVVRVQDVAKVDWRNDRPGQVDRYNMRRQVTITANVVGEDLGRVAAKVDEAIEAAGEPPRGAVVSVRGQVVPMRQLFGPLAFEPPWKVPVTKWFSGLSGGLIVAVVVILFLLIAYYQSVRLALVVVSTTPAVLLGVVGALALTRTTLNVQSFMGTIMAVGVAVANAILLATFADQARREGTTAAEAALEGARHRLRPILMTSCAMIAGMLPMASGLGEGGEQSAPLGRAVIGGLLAATFATLFLLPSAFAMVVGDGGARSASLDADDPESAHHDPSGAGR